MNSDKERSRKSIFDDDIDDQSFITAQAHKTSLPLRKIVVQNVKNNYKKLMRQYSTDVLLLSEEEATDMLESPEITEFVKGYDSLVVLNKPGVDFSELKNVNRSVLKDIKIVKLVSNKLHRIPKSLSALRNLTTLNLSYNNLIRIQPTEEIKIIFSHLKTLDLSNNQLKEFQKPLIQSMQKIRVLLLGYNLLSGIPSNIGDLSTLEVLHINANDLEYIPSSIANLAHLKEFHFDWLVYLDPPIHTPCILSIDLQRIMTKLGEISKNRKYVDFQEFPSVMGAGEEYNLNDLNLLCHATDYENLSFVRYYCEKLPILLTEADFDGYTPLKLSVEKSRNKSFDIVLQQVEKNLPKSIRTELLSECLIPAVKAKNLHIVRKLLNHGVDINQAKEPEINRNALHIAFRGMMYDNKLSEDDFEMLSLLISSGIDLNDLDEFSETPVLSAIKSDIKFPAFYALVYNNELKSVLKAQGNLNNSQKSENLERAKTCKQYFERVSGDGNLIQNSFNFGLQDQSGRACIHYISKHTYIGLINMILYSDPKSVLLVDNHLQLPINLVSPDYMISTKLLLKNFLKVGKLRNQGQVLTNEQLLDAASWPAESLLFDRMTFQKRAESSMVQPDESPWSQNRVTFGRIDLKKKHAIPELTRIPYPSKQIRLGGGQYKSASSLDLNGEVPKIRLPKMWMKRASHKSLSSRMEAFQQYSLVDHKISIFQIQEKSKQQVSLSKLKMTPRLSRVAHKTEMESFDRISRRFVEFSQSNDIYSDLLIVNALQGSFINLQKSLADIEKFYFYSDQKIQFFVKPKIQYFNQELFRIGSYLNKINTMIKNDHKGKRLRVLFSKIYLKRFEELIEAFFDFLSCSNYKRSICYQSSYMIGLMSWFFGMVQRFGLQMSSTLLDRISAFIENFQEPGPMRSNNSVSFNINEGAFTIPMGAYHFETNKGFGGRRTPREKANTKKTKKVKILNFGIQLSSGSSPGKVKKGRLRRTMIYSKRCKPDPK